MEALEEYYRLMAGHEPATNQTKAVLLIDQFLVWTKKRREESTYEWYRRHLQSFASYVGPKLLVANLKPGHVER